MLLLWPGWVRRKREDDFGRIGPALFAGTNNSDSSINKISSTSYSCIHPMEIEYLNHSLVLLVLNLSGTWRNLGTLLLCWFVHHWQTKPKNESASPKNVFLQPGIWNGSQVIKCPSQLPSVSFWGWSWLVGAFCMHFRHDLATSPISMFMLGQ